MHLLALVAIYLLSLADSPNALPITARPRESFLSFRPSKESSLVSSETKRGPSLKQNHRQKPDLSKSKDAPAELAAHDSDWPNQEDKSDFGAVSYPSLAEQAQGYARELSYPPASILLEEEGTLQLCLEIVRGRVVQAEVCKGSGYRRLDEAALKAAQNWTFASSQSGSLRQKVLFTLN